MALGIEQDILDTRCEYVNPFQVERGGILSLVTLSGIPYAAYEPNPTAETVPLGMMMHDQEEVDLWRALPPFRTARVFPEFTPYPYLILGTVVTNAVHPDIDPALVRPGAPAYLAPSGLITCVPTYNPRQIGTFQSLLNDPSIGAPNQASLMRVAGNEAIVNPDPVLVATAGWVKIRINV